MNLKTKSITRIALFVALIAIGSYISVPIGPVPMTLQTFFVLMAGTLLMPVEAFLSGIVYMLIGLIGIPIFAGGVGGLQSIFAPSFGFVIAFSIAGFVMAKITNGKTEMKRIILAIIVGQIIIYAIGLTYMYFMLARKGTVLNFSGVLAAGLTPFIPGDLVKSILCAVLTPIISKRLK